jgi:hypothetical protein
MMVGRSGDPAAVVETSSSRHPDGSGWRVASFDGAQPDGTGMSAVMDDIHAAAADLARLITAPAPPPEWLPVGIENGMFILRGYLDYVAKYPTRTELRDALDEVRKAALLLDSALSDLPLLPLIEEARATATDTPASLTTFLGFVNVLRSVVLPALSAAQDSIRTGKGRDQHLANPDGFSPRQFCAAWVAVAWSKVHGSPIQHTSPRAHNACEVLWTVAARSERSGWGTKNGGWRGALETVKADRHAERMLKLRHEFDAACLQLNSAI